MNSSLFHLNIWFLKMCKIPIIKNVFKFSIYFSEIYYGTFKRVKVIIFIY